MLAAELELMLGAVTWRLKAAADDAGLTPDALRETVRDGVMALEQLRPDLATLRLALADAEQDSLTALPNRRRFDDRLHDELGLPATQPRTLAVLFVDLDHFKSVNDRHGHEVGDALLRAVARRLARSVRAGDMVCRLGGDEFACLLAGPMRRAQIGRLASKLYAAVSAPLKLHGVSLHIRPSIGIALCPDDGADAALLLRRADAAMFRAKRQQCGHAFFNALTDQQSTGRIGAR